MKPVRYFCSNTPEINALTEAWCDCLELLSHEALHGLRLALAGKVYGVKCGIYSSAVPLSEIAEDVLGDPAHESHEDLPETLEMLDEISADEALKLIAFLSQ